MAERSFYVLAYDIVDDRRRLRVAKCLEAVGDRVQESVFEVYLTAAELDRLLKRLNKVLVKEDDSLRVYFLCEDCRRKARAVGRGQMTPPPGVKIV